MNRDEFYRYTLTKETLTVALAIMVDQNIVAISDLERVADDIGAIHGLLSEVFLATRTINK